MLRLERESDGTEIVSRHATQAEGCRSQGRKITAVTEKGTVQERQEVENLMARRGNKASLKQLSRSTHKGRPGRGLQPSNGSFGKTGYNKLTAPMIGQKLAPTPTGPEPGLYGKR